MRRMSQTNASSEGATLKLMISKTVLVLDGLPAYRKLDRLQVNRLGINLAGRYGAARVPERDNSRRRQAPQRT